LRSPPSARLPSSASNLSQQLNEPDESVLQSVATTSQGDDTADPAATKQSGTTVKPTAASTGAGATAVEANTPSSTGAEGQRENADENGDGMEPVEEESFYPSGERRRCRSACVACCEKRIRCVMLKCGSCSKCVDRGIECVARVGKKRGPPTREEQERRHREAMKAQATAMSSADYTPHFSGQLHPNIEVAPLGGPGLPSLGEPPSQTGSSMFFNSQHGPQSSFERAHVALPRMMCSHASLCGMPALQPSTMSSTPLRSMSARPNSLPSSSLPSFNHASNSINLPSNDLHLPLQLGNVAQFHLNRQMLSHGRSIADQMLPAATLQQETESELTPMEAAYLSVAAGSSMNQAQMKFSLAQQLGLSQLFDPMAEPGGFSTDQSSLTPNNCNFQGPCYENMPVPRLVGQADDAAVLGTSFYPHASLACQSSSAESLPYSSSYPASSLQGQLHPSQAALLASQHQQRHSSSSCNQPNVFTHRR